MNNYSDEIHVNIGTGEDVEIRELAQIIKEVVGYEGKIVNDLSKPDGTPRKLLDVSKLHDAGWKHRVELEEGIRRVYEWYVENEK
jgi:GDP-L-fucose synthase